MIDRLLKIFTRPEPKLALVSVPRDQHTISRKDISPNALKVLYRLKNSGHQAYLVGGCVRDLMLDKKPKDFDVATDATPEEVKILFKNSRVIGRRFKIVHVSFGREIIEVTTFRAGHDSAENQEELHPKHAVAAKSEHGMLVRDNVYGTMEEDALRRDFTVNAFYYSVEDFSLKVFNQGITDIQSKTLRIIGNPETRYREDPVRMLRAARFAAKLEFELEPQTASKIPALSELLHNVAPARLFDETLKLFVSGHALASFRKLGELGLLKALLPATELSLQQDESGFYTRFIEHALLNTDRRVLQSKPVTPAFLYAALLWPAVNEQYQQLKNTGTPPSVALHKASQHVIGEQNKTTAIPKRFSIPMREIWELQLRLPRKQRARALAVLEHPRFRAAYDFLLLREEAGETTDGLGQWWTEFQQSDPAAQDIISQKQVPIRKEPGNSRPPRHRRKRPSF
ncbi:polynucleotide adenylyltransferase PcnB [Gynuella sunshinyii]|uniref:Poly(A) polymerase I n=1 Tax=Gynuella sunshinyii YC6258 TaxID=1445510 RepID=A0A0C5W3R2_9GAMM|nr:polynucleotide adenylyltransferase PcnB [Gynuella sunshinyii]AJQ97244.1 tRNA nucleotidyltransferase/poly(A) polymerase [Gynuella sunshinyii YC6258]